MEVKPIQPVNKIPNKLPEKKKSFWFAHRFMFRNCKYWNNNDIADNGGFICNYPNNTGYCTSGDCPARDEILKNIKKV